MSYKANITSNLINQVMRLVIGALTSILVARVLGPTGQGYVAYIILIFTLLGDYGHLGLNNAVMYFQKRRDYPRNHLYSVNVTTLVLLTLVIMAILMAVKGSGLALQGYNWLYIAAGVLLVCSDFLFTHSRSLYIGDERIPESNFKGIIAFLSKSVLIVLLWLLGVLTPLSFFAVTAISMLLNALLLQARLGLKYSPAIDLSLLSQEYMYGGIIWMGAVFCFLLYRVDQFMIRRMLGMDDLGVYSVAVSLAELMFLIPLSITSALLGRLYNINDVSASRNVLAKTFKLTLYVCAGLALIGMPLCLLIPVLYGSAYSGAVVCTMILLAATVFASLATVSSQYYFSLGKPSFNLYASLGALLLNIVLNIVLIPSLGIAGSALASAISYFAYGSFFLVLLLKREKFSAGELLLLKSSDISELWRLK